MSVSSSRSSHKFDLLLSKLNIPHDKRPNEEADKEWLGCGQILIAPHY